MLTGDIQMALVPPGVAMSHVQSGRLRAVGVASGRCILVPDVAPLSASGLSGVDLEVGTALVGPARLSAGAKERLAREIPRLAREEDLRQTLFRQGWQAVGGSPEALTGRVREEAATMRKIIAIPGVALD